MWTWRRLGSFGVGAETNLGSFGVGAGTNRTREAEQTYAVKPVPSAITASVYASTITSARAVDTCGIASAA